jgi:hypothetical protein
MNKWKVNAPAKAALNNETLVLKGQGLGDTKWKGWAWNSALVDRPKKKKINYVEYIF